MGGRGRTLGVVAALGLALPVGSAAAAPLDAAGTLGMTPAPATSAAPLAFEPNRGQLADGVTHAARGDGFGLFLTRAGATLVSGRDVSRVRFGGDAAPGVPQAVTRLPGVVDAFVGTRPVAGIPTFAAVRYPHVWDGVDVVFHGRGGALEYDLLLQPGADVRRARLRFPQGRPRIAADGALLTGTLRQPAPIATQGRTRVDVAYVVHRDGTVGFRLGPHDPGAAVQIDPVLDFARYLGGDDKDDAAAVDVAPDGTTWVTGRTRSVDFPDAGAPATPDDDAYLTAIDPNGAVVRTVYLGGATGTDRGTELVVRGNDSVVLLGETASDDLPVTAGAAQATIAGSTDAFVARITPGAVTPVTSLTYFGGTPAETAAGLAVAGDGTAWIAGATAEAAPGDRIPVTADAIRSTPSSSEGYVAAVTPDGTTFPFASFVGGDALDSAVAVAVDGTNRVWVTGSTSSASFPAATDPAGRDAYLVRLDGTTGARTLGSARLLGGPGLDFARDLKLDSDGDPVLVGEADPGFPTTTGAEVSGPWDAFVARVDAETGAATWSTVTGGTGEEDTHAVDTDGDEVVLQGTTRSANFPVVRPIAASARAGGSDVFVARYTAAGAVRFATLLGGDALDEGGDVAFGTAGRVVSVGLTQSSNFLGQGGAPFDDNAFVAVLDDSDVTGPAVTIAPASVPPALTASQSASITWSAAETATFECRLDDAAQFTACTSPANLDGLADGQHTFRVRAIDTNGNAGPVASATWTVDATPPDTSFTSTPPAESASRTAAFVPASATASTFTCTLDGTRVASCADPVTGLSDGSHTFTARAIDAASNQDPTPASYTWVVDATEPAAFDVTAPADGAVNLPPRPTFTWPQTTDAGVGVAAYDLWVDGVRIGDASCASGCTAVPPALGDGPHTWFARAVDRLGNARVTATRSFTVDATPPAAFALTGPADGAALASGALTLSWAPTTDAGAGLAGYRLVLDGAAVDVQGATSREVAGLGEGTHRWSVVARDVHGNERSSGERTFVVDVSAPVASFVAAPNPSFAGRTVTFDGGGSSDAVSGVAGYEWDLDGDGSFETDTGGASSATRVFPEPGVYATQLRVRDRAGLVSAPARVDVRIAADRAAGGRQLGVSVLDGALHTRAREVTLDVVAPSWADQMLVSNDGGFARATRVAVSSSLKWTLESTGAERSARIVYVRFLRGNTVSETYTDDIILDQLAPVVASARVVGRTVRLSARDRGLAGVSGLQVATSRRTKAKTFAKFASRVKVSRRRARRTLYVRVRDRAGNRSAFVRVKR